jgi:hypothetical protein
VHQTPTHSDETERFLCTCDFSGCASIMFDNTIPHSLARDSMCDTSSAASHIADGICHSAPPASLLLQSTFPASQTVEMTTYLSARCDTARRSCSQRGFGSQHRVGHLKTTSGSHPNGVAIAILIPTLLHLLLKEHTLLQLRSSTQFTI